MREAAKEEERQERAARKAEEAEERARRIADARRDRKLHEAFRLRFNKVARGPGKRDLDLDARFEAQVATLQLMCSQCLDVRSCAVRTLPPDAAARRGEGLVRSCELFVVLHKAKRKSLAAMRSELSAAAGKSPILHAWEPAEAREWKELGDGFVIVRDESPPSKHDAKLLLEVLVSGPDGLSEGPPKSRSGARKSGTKRPSSGGVVGRAQRRRRASSDSSTQDTDSPVPESDEPHADGGPAMMMPTMTMPTADDDDAAREDAADEMAERLVSTVEQGALIESSSSASP